MAMRLHVFVIPEATNPSCLLPFLFPFMFLYHHRADSGAKSPSSTQPKSAPSGQRSWVPSYRLSGVATKSPIVPETAVQARSDRGSPWQ